MEAEPAAAAAAATGPAPAAAAAASQWLGPAVAALAPSCRRRRAQPLARMTAAAGALALLVAAAGDEQHACVCNAGPGPRASSGRIAPMQASDLLQHLPSPAASKAACAVRSASTQPQSSASARVCAGAAGAGCRLVGLLLPEGGPAPSQIARAVGEEQQQQQWVGAPHTTHAPAAAAACGRICDEAANDVAAGEGSQQQQQPWRRRRHASVGQAGVSLLAAPSRPAPPRTKTLTTCCGQQH
jgi:hypothetical protein